MIKTCPTCKKEFHSVFKHCSVKCSKSIIHQATRRKMSLAKKGKMPKFIPDNHGRHHSLETIEKMRKSSYWKGKHLPKEMVQRMKGRVVTDETRRKIGLSSKGRRHTEEQKRKIGLKSIGNKYGWKGGLTPVYTLIRCSLKYSEWRQKVFTRDMFTCMDCGDKTGGNLEAHHVKSFSVLVKESETYFPLLNLYDSSMLYSPLWDIDNGKTLCEKCHRKYFKNTSKVRQ